MTLAVIYKWAYGVVVGMFAFHRSNRGRGGEFHDDKHYTLVPSVNTTCHPSEVSKWVPVKLLLYVYRYI